MPAFKKAVDLLADLLRRDGKVTYRASIDARIAPYIMPLLDRLVADDEDGDTLRTSLIPWKRAERPPLAIYRGDVSTCRIDGPWQTADDRWIPLGGLVLTSGLTWHLSPFAAQALHKHMQKVIDDATNEWVNEYGPELRRHVPPEINRERADREAKAMIAAWATGQTKSNAMPGNARDCCSDEPDNAWCKACRKGPDHA